MRARLNALLSEPTVQWTNEIIAAAKVKNVSEINSLIQHVAIDVLYQPYLTAACVLAMQGEIEAVNFLQNDFGASKLNIMYGYCTVNNTTMANDLLLNAKPHEKLSLLEMMMFACAKAGNFFQTRLILDLNPGHRIPLLIEMADGFAASGTQADEALKILQRHFSEDPANLYLLLQRLAVSFGAHNNEHAINYITLLAGKDAALKSSIEQRVACGYIQVGNVNKLINMAETSSPTLKLKLLQFAIHITGLLGNISLTKSILKNVFNADEEFALTQDMICGFATGGHQHMVQFILERETDPLKLYNLTRYAIKGFAKANNTPAVRILCSLPIFAPILKKLISDAIEYFVKGNNIEAAYQLLSTINEPRLKTKLIIKMMKPLAQKHYLYSACNTIHLLATEEDKLEAVKIIASSLHAYSAQYHSLVNTMALLDKSLQKEFALHCARNPQVKIKHINAITYRANTINANSKIFNLNFHESWACSTAKYWLLICIKLVKDKKLESNLFLLITTFLAPVTKQETVKLYDTLTQHFFRAASNRKQNPILLTVKPDSPVSQSRMKRLLIT